MKARPSLYPDSISNSQRQDGRITPAIVSSAGSTTHVRHGREVRPGIVFVQEHVAVECLAESHAVPREEIRGVGWCSKNASFQVIRGTFVGLYFAVYYDPGMVIGKT